MIYSKLNHFIFLKTRKTGGTSVELALRGICGPRDIITPVDEQGPSSVTEQNYMMRRRDWRLKNRVRWSLGFRAPRFSPFIPIPDHIHAADLRRLVGAKAFDGAYRFSIERNPWDRQVSNYFWQIRSLPEERKPSFADWLASDDPELKVDNWRIYAIDDRLAVHRVLRYEHLADDLAQLARERGWALPPLPRAKGHLRPQGGYREYYTPQTRDLVASWYRHEIEVFDYDF
ncbi:sulfotransferase family protein [Xanthobacter agilis]|uniref:Sulfotransferase family protein n=1 Tax=Xanthobacter agilis TaxID=47492 RepID=A0ABU0LFY6_XANAG|nr:sulfotransferase family protein [Xanthobacter agilis]MDQ0506046.1 hypothetical protein [Xanthobacter agilis]